MIKFYKNFMQECMMRHFYTKILLLYEIINPVGSGGDGGAKSWNNDFRDSFDVTKWA